MTSLATKTAKSSMDYVNAINARTTKPTKAARAATLNKMKKSADAMTRIGQGFIGPVMMRLKYEGIVRNILTEDVIAPGDIPVYDVADEMGKAYFLDTYQGEAVISQYEGKRLMYGFLHIAAFPTVQEQDLLELTIDMTDYAMNEARQRIQELEDGYLFSMLDNAIAGITANNPDFAGLTSHVVNAASSTAFAPGDFYSVAAKASQNRLDAVNIILNPADYFDILGWDLVATSVNFKDKTFDGVPVTTFAGFQILRSVMAEAGTAYMMPTADYVGRMPVRKSLDIVDNPKVENFSLGWVMDEYINELILNSNGLFKITK